MRKPVIALDFDGVLCDSARETALSAWRAGASYWNEWKMSPPEDEHIRRFLHLRPALETGFQAILMMRMIADGRPDADIADNLAEACCQWIERLGVTRSELIACFGAARDQWILSDLDGWLASHRFYPGTVDALMRVLPDHDVFILTTKQERFVHALLRGQGVSLASDRVFGLDRGLQKTAILSDFVRNADGAAVHFVEDRAATLRGVLELSGLLPVHLYYAPWGYGTRADLTWATEHPRVTVWNRREFLVL